VTDDWICLIYATAILLRPQTLQRAHARAMAAGSKTDFIMGLCPYPHPPQRAVRFGAGQDVAMVAPENAMTRTQDLEPLYHDAAQFVFGRRSAWMDGRTAWNSPTEGVIMSAHEAVDIDTPDDLAMATALLHTALGDGS
jgi:N-acylneuraminate cytidylyltransferase